jgi:hypothetical protein
VTGRLTSQRLSSSVGNTRYRRGCRTTPSHRQKRLDCVVRGSGPLCCQPAWGPGPCGSGSGCWSIVGGFGLSFCWGDEVGDFSRRRLESARSM